MNIKKIIKEEVAKRMKGRRINEEVKVNLKGELVNHLTSLKLQGFDINNQGQQDALNNLLTFIDNEYLKFQEIKNENDEIGFFRSTQQDDKNTQYFVKKQGIKYPIFMMAKGNDATVSKQFHDAVANNQHAKTLSDAWGSGYNFDDKQFIAFLNAYFKDTTNFKAYTITGVDTQLTQGMMWNDIIAKKTATESFNRLLKTIIREEVRKALRSAQPAQRTKGKGPASAASRLTEASEWEVGKRVQYKNLRTGKSKTNKIIKNLGNGKWELDGGHIAYENDPEFELIKPFTGKFHELESYVKANRDEILSNMKTYGFTRGGIDKMTNFVDVANLLGVDSNLLRYVDLGEYTKQIKGSL